MFVRFVILVFVRFGLMRETTEQHLGERGKGMSHADNTYSTAGHIDIVIMEMYILVPSYFGFNILAID